MLHIVYYRHICGNYRHICGTAVWESADNYMYLYSYFGNVDHLDHNDTMGEFLNHVIHISADWSFYADTSTCTMEKSLTVPKKWFLSHLSSFKKRLLYAFFSNISRPKSMKEHSAFIYRLNEFLIKSQSYIRATSNVTFNNQKTACSIQFHFAILSSIIRCLNGCFIESAVLFIS